MKAEELLKEIDEELIEWKEHYGRGYPSFLNHVLANRLIKAQDYIDYLERIRKATV